MPLTVFPPLWIWPPKTATVTLSANVSDETLTKAVTDAGYTVVSIA